jgi:tripartite-type tricarboxylate transporter receptor subunit TctC
MRTTKKVPGRKRAAARRAASANAITLIVPYVKDGGTDKRSRLLARFLRRELKTPIRVVNRTGAVAGHTAIAQAAPDGRTLGMITGEIGMMHWHDGVTDLTWRSYTPLGVPYVEAAAIIVRQDAPYKDLAGFLAAARRQPIRGAGSPDFGVWKFALVGLLEKSGIPRSQLRWTETVSGEEGIAKVIAGEVDVAPVPMVEAPELIFSHKVRPLATMDGVRHPLFPDVPTVKEAIGLDWQVAHWRGLVAPAGLPARLKTRVVTALRRIARDPEFKATCRRRGFSLGWRIDRGFAAYMHEDDALFGRVIRPQSN